MKRIGILLALMLAFCTAAAAQPLQVVATIFPICDWTREIIGETEGVELTMLMGGGVDLHSFQPSAQDIMRVSSCDVFIDIGGVSDEWAKDALATAVNGQQRVLHLLDALGNSAKLEELWEEYKLTHSDVPQDLTWEEILRLLQENTANGEGINRLPLPDGTAFLIALLAVYAAAAVHHKKRLQETTESPHSSPTLAQGLPKERQTEISTRTNA